MMMNETKISGIRRNTDPTIWRDSPKRYNCGSFALDLLRWYIPYEDEDDREEYMNELWENDYSTDEIADILAEADWDYILRDCPWLTPIEDPSEAADHERVIAYRTYVKEESWGLDEDFHFQVRINGFWFDKCGSEEIRFLGKDTQYGPWDSGELVYTSATFYAKVKES